MAGRQYIFIILGLLLLVVTCVQQYRRRNKKNLVLRLAASAVAAVSLACLALNITYTGNATDETSAIILTDGYNTDSVNLFKTSHVKMPVYSFDEYIAAGISSHPALHVFGTGLSTDDLQQLQGTPVIFHHQPVNTGIISANWQQTLQTGAQLNIQGSFNNTTNSPVKLQLNGLSTLLDSVTVQPVGIQPFRLVATPKQAGKAVYTITALADDKTIEEEFVPVDVKPADSIKVLILAASPDFENRFLKNWLADNNCEVVVRSTTSKGKFDRSFLNTSSANIDHITTQNLSNFDVVISDATEYAALTGDEQNAVRSTVEAGLGLIIKTDTTLPPAFYTSLFPVVSGPSNPSSSTLLKLVGGTTLHAPENSQTLFIQNRPGTQPLVTDSTSQVLVNSAVYGMGKVAVTTLNNTYSWVLTGDKHNYTTYWSSLLSKVAKTSNTGQSISFSPAFATVDQPLHLTFTANANPYPIINGSPVYLAQNIHLPFEWGGTYWAAQTGWQTIKLEHDSTSFYTYTNTDWKPLRGFANTIATEKYVAAQQTVLPGGDAIKLQDVPVPKIYFVIVFFVSCAFLWAERNFTAAN